MSTRRGETIFLDDVLNEAKARALESIMASPSMDFVLNEFSLVQHCLFLDTKINPDEYDHIADVLGVSSLIIHDLCNRRVKEYRFNWSKALRISGDTGISLQYTHARLCK